MGIFSFFRKKPKQLIENTLIDCLNNKLNSKGYISKISEDGSEIECNGIQIVSEIFSFNDFDRAATTQLNFLIYHKDSGSKFFEMLAGVGKNRFAALTNGVENFMYLFDFFYNAVYDKVTADSFLVTTIGTKDVSWKCYFSQMLLQGERRHDNNPHVFFNFIKQNITNVLQSEKIFFLKIYTAKQANGEIIAQCLLNGEPFTDADKQIIKYVESIRNAEFWGEKQYLLFVPNI